MLWGALQWHRYQNGRVKTPKRRFCAMMLDRSSAESEAMEAASRLQLIAASCSAIQIDLKAHFH
ncbi:hypothetical protein [Salicibibacter cibi]|uniref:hypothetical protein n=1 Tax=Salicibibacter cibi TaxID=2743001 RepID=UPI001B7D7EA3|nr:hypothetical protein [Salicibibacter cibi]